MPFPATPALTTDCVVFDARGYVLLIRRKYEPFKGAYALPGGFIEVGETVESGCRRELKEETGLEVGALRLVGVYSRPRSRPARPYLLHRLPGAASAAPSRRREMMRLPPNGWPTGARRPSPSITHRSSATPKSCSDLRPQRPL